MTIDHIIPKSKGGTNHKKNLQALCEVCNSLKANKIESHNSLKQKDLQP